MGRRRKKRNKSMNIVQLSGTVLVSIIVILMIYFSGGIENFTQNTTNTTIISYSSVEEIPEYSGEICVEINDNKPYFSEEEYTTEAFEEYSELDYLGRCGVAYANICKETMPPEGDERGSISSVYPTGWKQTKYDGEYLYNRCHLIAYSLSDEDANEQNLITGTRYFNIQGMLTMERQILEYMDEHENNHVLYRVTPIFEAENLLATGVQMEAYSVEDNGEGICFNVFIYNVQPGANINYATGELISD